MGQEIFGMKKYAFSKCRAQKSGEKKKLRVHGTREKEDETSQCSQPKRCSGVSELKMLKSNHTNHTIVHRPPQRVAASSPASSILRVWPEHIAISRHYEK